jgi:hypothetical protein
VARNAPTNASAWDNSGAETDAMTARLYSATYHLRRSFLFFDLSGLPAGASIISVIISILGHSNATSSILVLQGTQHDPLQNADWNAFTGSGFSLVTWTKKLAGQVNMNEMTLNWQGRAYIRSCAGSTAKFCLLEYEHDSQNVAPTDNVHFNGMFFADHTEPTYRPYVTIIYKP